MHPEYREYFAAKMPVAIAEATTAPSGFCPQCGATATTDAKFCRCCGVALTLPIPQPEPSPQRKNDPLLGLRIVLLIATGASALVAPWLVTAFLALAWIVTLVLPSSARKKEER